jgi:hypothetical protein
LAYLGQKKSIGLIDIRTFELKRYTFKGDITAICVLNENSIIYGTEKGEIGLFDNRK